MRGYWLYIWGRAQSSLGILYSKTKFIIIVVVEPFLGNTSYGGGYACNNRGIVGNGAF
jgi:hypothetical protein